MKLDLPLLKFIFSNMTFVINLYFAVIFTSMWYVSQYGEYNLVLNSTEGLQNLIKEESNLVGLLAFIAILVIINLFQVLVTMAFNKMLQIKPSANIQGALESSIQLVEKLFKSGLAIFNQNKEKLFRGSIIYFTFVGFTYLMGGISSFVFGFILVLFALLMLAFYAVCHVEIKSQTAGEA